MRATTPAQSSVLSPRRVLVTSFTLSPMPDRFVDVLDLGDDFRAAVSECEISGSRTTFHRNLRPVAVLVSHDEYVALRETVSLVGDEPLGEAIQASDAEFERGAMLLLDELTGVRERWNDRLRFAERVEADWGALPAPQRDTVVELLRRLDDDPLVGVPLFEPLRSLWSFTSGDLRIVYRVAAEARMIAVLAIGRRGQDIDR